VGQDVKTQESQKPIPVASKSTKVVIVRHAEKGATAPDDADTPLTKDGEKRAETLARMLKVSGVSEVFSTQVPKASGKPGKQYKRTKETVNNYADPKSITIQYYDYSTQGTQNLVKLIKSKKYVGKSILVAGHSDTVPNLVESLGVKPAPKIDDEFNNLLLVTIAPDGSTSLTHLKYEIWKSVP
jgi:phosphohistidine phosphatase SixA